MPDAAKKWLEKKPKKLIGAKYQFWTSCGEAHLRRLLEQNERLEATIVNLDDARKNDADFVAMQVERLHESQDAVVTLEAASKALVAYVRALEGGFLCMDDPVIVRLRQALSPELQELIDG